MATAFSSSFACLIIPQIWAMTTGEKKHMVMTVGTSCCLMILTPALKAIFPSFVGRIVIFNAERSPKAALKKPPYVM